jgi:hypothetical protein
MTLVLGEEWEKITENIIKKAAFESLGMMKKHNRRKYLRTWDD